MNKCLLHTEPEQAQGAAQPASPNSQHRGGSTWFHCVRATFYRIRDAAKRRRAAVLAARTKFWKKSVASNCTQTDSSERQPLRQIQDNSLILAPKRVALSAQESTCSQPELKQCVIDANALQIASLRHELAALQAKLQLSACKETAARRDALGAALRLWHDEEQGRADLLLEMSNEWQARMLALHVPSCDQADDGATEDHTSPQEANDIVLSRTCGAELARSESGVRYRDPDYARKCLFIDQICHWVASFVRRDWALVCSATATAVHRVMLQVYDIWSSTTKLIGRFQSSGPRLRSDLAYFGPEDGPLVAAREAVLDLRAKAAEGLIDGHPSVRWCSRFILHVRLTAHIYEEMRIRHRQVFNSLHDRAQDLEQVLITLEQTLEKHDARLANAEDSTIDDPHSAES